MNDYITLYNQLTSDCTTFPGKTDLSLDKKKPRPDPLGGAGDAIAVYEARTWRML